MKTTSKCLECKHYKETPKGTITTNEDAIMSMGNVHYCGKYMNLIPDFSGKPDVKKCSGIEKKKKVVKKK